MRKLNVLHPRSLHRAADIHFLTIRIVPLKIIRYTLIESSNRPVSRKLCVFDKRNF